MTESIQRILLMISNRKHATNTTMFANFEILRYFYIDGTNMTKSMKSKGKSQIGFVQRLVTAT